MDQNDQWKELMREVSSALEEKTGLFFPPDRWKMLHEKLESVRRTLGMKSVQHLAKWLNNHEPNQKQIESLARYLTVGETYFFRDRNIYEEIEKHVLPEMLQKKRKEGSKKIRIWSAGCATGEEAYSIAITLKKAIPDIQAWDISILGSDINRLALEKARQGKYRNWSFRRNNPAKESRYFRKLEPGIYQIGRDLKTMVSFQFLNLARDKYPSAANHTSAFDIIFCRNVMIYFQPKLIDQILKQFCDCLVPGGWLLVGGSEGALVRLPHMKMVRFPGANFYRKEGPFNAYVHPPNHSTIPDKTYPPLLDITNMKSMPVEQHSERLVDQRDEIQLARGITLFERQKFVDATEILENIKDSNLDKVKIRKLLIRSYLCMGRPVLALEHGRDLELLASDDHEVYYLYGMIYREMGEWSVALQQLKKALYLEPSYSLTQYMAGSIYQQIGDRIRAIKHLERAAVLFRKIDLKTQIPDTDGITASGFSMIVQSMLSHLKENEPKTN